ncbi:MAG: hypothetical protein ACKOB0_15320, partial [Chthoniobacterales bacterium]
MHHQSVAQRFDVVVQHDSHAIDVFGQLGPHLGIGGFVQMHDGNAGRGEQGTQTPTHIRPTND